MMRREVGRKVIYKRALPGGGFVTIQAHEMHRLFRGTVIRGEIVVERRPENRRAGHVPPTVAVAEARDVGQLWRELFPIASSNSMLARACMRVSPGHPMAARPEMAGASR
jgi:hypothetical protein